MKYTAIRVYKERSEILEHILRLSVSDRYLRFCSSVGDESIKKYVDKIDLRSTTSEAVFAVFDDNRNIVGMCHVAPPYEDYLSANSAEMAISVDENMRKQGIGDVLFHRGVLHCESVGIKKIYMNCLATNTPIQKLARRSGMSVTTSYGESVANLNLEDKNAIVAFLESVRNDAIGLYDVNLRYASAQWFDYLSMLNSIIQKDSTK